MAPPVVPFPRALYPASNVKGPVTDNDDVIAVKRAISRAGFFPWNKFDDAYSEKFAMEGVKPFQQQNGLTASGFYGTATHNKLVETRAKGKPTEWAFDPIAIKLMETAKKEMTAANKNVPLETARKLLATCRLFTGSYLWGGGHDSSLADDRFSMRGDCSWSTSYALYLNGLLGSTRSQVSTWFETYGDAGRGKYVTIHANWEHVWTEFSLPEGYFRFDTSPHGDGPSGPRVRTHDRPDSRFVHRHPKGL